MFLVSQVNGQSMLGAAHVEAVRALRNTGDRLNLIVCEGYDSEAASNSHSSIIANPAVMSDMTRKLYQTSSESISSIDREASTDVSFPFDFRDLSGIFGTLRTSYSLGLGKLALAF